MLFFRALLSAVGGPTGAAAGSGVGVVGSTLGRTFGAVGGGGGLGLVQGAPALAGTNIVIPVSMIAQAVSRAQAMDTAVGQYRSGQ
jgi:hypothetical protein